MLMLISLQVKAQGLNKAGLFDQEIVAVQKPTARVIVMIDRDESILTQTSPGRN